MTYIPFSKTEQTQPLPPKSHQKIWFQIQKKVRIAATRVRESPLGVDVQRGLERYAPTAGGRPPVRTDPQNHSDPSRPPGGGAGHPWVDLLRKLRKLRMGRRDTETARAPGRVGPVVIQSWGGTSVPAVVDRMGGGVLLHCPHWVGCCRMHGVDPPSPPSRFQRILFL